MADRCANARWVALCGGATTYSADSIRYAYRLGQALGRAGYSVVDGATSGIPHAAVRGAKDAGATTAGVSPFVGEDDHVASGRPTAFRDWIVFAGSGLDGRSPLITRSAFAAVFLEGSVGTLLEFCSAIVSGPRLLIVDPRSAGPTIAALAELEAIAQVYDRRVVRAGDIQSVLAALHGHVRAPLSVSDASVDRLIEAAPDFSQPSR